MAFVSAMKRFSRLRDIIKLLIKEGFDEIVQQLHFDSPLHLGGKFNFGVKKKPTSQIPERLRRVMDEAGGAFVKIGQMLSLRSDLIPQEYCDEFSKLQDNVKPFPFSQVKIIIEEQLKKQLKEIFIEFNEQPIASASVGQVHRAKLKTGEIVAVKIQRPDIKKTFEADIDLLHYIAEEAEKYLESLRPFKPKKIVEEFEKYTEKELDYTLEAKNIEIFYEHYKLNPQIKIPKVFWDYTTNKVLTMEFIEGKKISEIQDLSKEQRKKIALTFYHSMITQVFEIRVFHADPHPGNIFLMKNGKIALLDFGIVGRISKEMAENVEMMLVGLVKGDLDLLSRSFIEVGVINESIDRDKLKEDLFEAWAEYHGVSLNKINMKRFFEDTFNLGRKYDMEFPSNFVLLVKAVVTAEGFAKQIYPESNFIEICGPQVEKILKIENSPKNMLKDFKNKFIEFNSSLRKLPQDLRSIMYILKNGPKVKLEVDHKELSGLTIEIDRSSNRLTLGLIMGGTIIATGMFVIAGLEPRFYGIPYLAWLSGLITIFLAVMLGISIIREGKGVD